jgi:hypothetical protein
MSEVTLLNQPGMMIGVVAVMFGALAIVVYAQGQSIRRLRAMLRDTAAPVAPQSTTVRARRIELEDASGKLRAALKIEASGTVAFELMSAEGRTRAMLGVSAGGAPMMMLAEQAEKLAVEEIDPVAANAKGDGANGNGNGIARPFSNKPDRADWIPE